MRGTKATLRLLIAGAVLAVIGEFIKPYIGALAIGLTALGMIGLIVILITAACLSNS